MRHRLGGEDCAGSMERCASYQSAVLEFRRLYLGLKGSILLCRLIIHEIGREERNLLV